MKKILPILVALGALGLFIYLVPIWTHYLPWTGEKSYITTWDKIIRIYYADKVVF